MAMTNAERQKLYRKRRTMEGKIRHWQYKNPFAVEKTADEAASKKAILEAELQAERIAEQRKEGRKLAKRADESRSLGKIAGICSCADYFIGKERVDIAKALLTHFSIDRDKAVSALQADKRVKNLTLTILDKYIWEQNTVTT